MCSLLCLSRACRESAVWGRSRESTAGQRSGESLTVPIGYVGYCQPGQRGGRVGGPRWARARRSAGGHPPAPAAAWPGHGGGGRRRSWRPPSARRVAISTRWAWPGSRCTRSRAATAGGGWPAAAVPISPGSVPPRPGRCSSSPGRRRRRRRSSRRRCASSCGRCPNRCAPMPRRRRAAIHVDPSTWDQAGRRAPSAARPPRRPAGGGRGRPPGRPRLRRPRRRHLVTAPSIPLGIAAKGSVWYLVAGTADGQRTFRDRPGHRGRQVLDDGGRAARRVRPGVGVAIGDRADVQRTSARRCGPTCRCSRRR